MSSLKYSFSISAIPTQTIRPTSTSPPPEKKKKMSLTQTYVLAHQARGKLSKEAGRPTHNLRRLVGHANMLDNLMLDLANAEQEQENWFNQSVKSASKATDSEPKHIHWADTVPEEVFEDDEDSDSEAEEEDALPVSIRRVGKTPPPPTTSDYEDEEMEDDDDYEEGLALTRTSSHPPELMQDSDSDSDDDMPPSPPSTSISFDALSEKQRQAIATTGFYQTTKEIEGEDDSFFDHALPAPISAF